MNEALIEELRKAADRRVFEVGGLEDSALLRRAAVREIRRRSMNPWWLLVICPASAAVGALLMALCQAGAKEDERSGWNE